MGRIKAREGERIMSKDYRWHENALVLNIEKNKGYVRYDLLKDDDEMVYLNEEELKMFYHIEE